MTSQDDLESRLAALEALAERSQAERVEEARLTAGIDRLGDGVGDLNALLTTVNDNALRLAKVEKEGASKSEVVEQVEQVKAESEGARRNALRRAYTAAAAVAAFTLCTVVGGAWLTDAHIQHCILHGPSNEHERQLCNIEFPGHDHPEEQSLDYLLYQGAVQAHTRCLNSNKATQSTIARERALAAAETNMSLRAVHTRSADSLQKSITNCDVTAPLPKEPK